MREMNLPEHWKAVRLGNYIFKPEYGYTASATHDSIGAKFLRITDIQDDSVDWKDVPFCECDEDTQKKYLLVPGDIVIARIGATTGKTFLVDDCPESIFASYLIRVKTKPSLCSAFLFAYFRTEDYWRQIHQNKGGRLKGGVNIPILQTLKIPLPPLPEQRTIAHVLQTIQEAKSTRQRELALERERKAALMDYLFSYGTKDEPRKQTEIGEIPEGWDMVRLGDIADITYGVQAAVAHLLDESIGIPILTNINITLEGTFDLSTLRYYELPKNKRGQLILEKGDVLFNWRSGSQHHVGKTVLFDLNGEYTFSSFILRFRFVEKIKNKFALHYFHYLRKKGFFALKRSQSSVNSVFNASKSAEIPVIVPSIDEQSGISDVLQACDTKIVALEQEADRLDELFHAMLDELMTGQRSALPLIDAELPHSSGIMEGKRLEGVPSEDSPKTETCLRSL